MSRWDTDLQKFFPNIGFSSLKEDQEKVLNTLVDNGNTLGIIQTGGGKSMIYWMACLGNERNCHCYFSANFFD